MKQVHISRGRAIVLDVPAPGAGPGEVLVRVRASCLSVGTEMSGVRASGMPLWKRALRHPEQVSTALRMASAEGVMRTWQTVRQKTGKATPTGYSAAGIVSEVGEGVEEFSVGDRVACAGAGYAHHAEVVRVPRNLVAPVPDGVAWQAASTVTLGAIALQGVRRANPTLGETFVVIGLGILGQITCQLLRANGCRVIGIDLDETRIELARGLGMDLGLKADDADEAQQVARLTGGLGADGAIVTAATPSDEVMSTAFGVCRRKGRVVLVGDVGLNLKRADIYAKELDFLVSTSYGPGRYDRRYEEEGLDYPHAYVRWTENRNMQAYLDLLATGQVSVAPLVSASYPVSDATAAYAAASASGADRPLMVLLSYPDDDATAQRTVTRRAARPGGDGRIGVAVVGAGSFARGVHLPNLRQLDGQYSLQAVVSRDGANANAVAADFEAPVASTDFDAVLENDSVDAVVICTRHHLHASMALAALEAGKHVLLEKPLALTHEEVDRLDAFVQAKGASGPILLTGYNRRFSPCARAARDFLSDRSGPFMIDYRMNAGFVPRDHWVHGPEGGGRNLGEACHVYDLFLALSGASALNVSAQGVGGKLDVYGRRENFVATLSLSDGSVATLIYSSMGSPDYAKESAEIFVDGNVLVLDDYQRMAVHGERAQVIEEKRQDKGHLEELRAFAAAIKSGDWPIPWAQQVEVARIALAVDEVLKAPA